MRFLILSFLIFLCGAAAADSRKLNLTFYGSFVYSPEVPNALFLFAEIKKNDSFELRRALRNESIDTIVLASNGGAVWEALSMAGVIFDRKLATYVPKLPDGKGCYSACSLMFFAGNSRIAEGGLGVHQVGAYDDEIDAQKRELGATQQSTQFTTSEIIGFLNEFQTPPWVFERMFRSREMYQFTEDEKTELNQGEVTKEVQNRIKIFLTALLTNLKEESDQITKAPKVKYFNVRDREMVRVVQSALNLAKCSPGSADGVWGRRTNSAASRFAKANGLSYSNAKSITAEFLTKLNASNKQSCPPLPKPEKTKRSISGKWAMTFNCRRQRVTGTAIVRRAGGNFGVTYVNNLGGQYRGAIRFTAGNHFSWAMEQTNGNDGSFGAAEISADMNTIIGNSTKGCILNARRRG